MSKKSVVGASSAGILSTVFASLGMVSCCGMPIIASILATVGIGASELSFFSEYQPYFITVSVVAIAYGFWTLYFRNPKKTSCCASSSSCCESRPKRKIWPHIILWIAAASVAYVLCLSPESPKPASSDAATPATDSCCPSPSKNIEAIEREKESAPACSSC